VRRALQRKSFAWENDVTLLREGHRTLCEGYNRPNNNTVD